MEKWRQEILFPALLVVLIVAMVLVLRAQKEAGAPVEQVAPAQQRGSGTLPPEPSGAAEATPRARTVTLGDKRTIVVAEPLSPRDRRVRLRAPYVPNLPSCVPVPMEVDLRVATFNIKYGNHGGRRTLGAIGDAIARWDADVVLLQEVTRYYARTGYADMPNALAARLGMHAAWGANVVRGSQGRGRPRSEYGTAVLSRFPILEQGNTHLPNRPGMEQRGLLHAVVDVDGQPVSVYGTHLQHNSASMRMQQIRTIVGRLRADRNPRVFGGDLNDPPRSAVYRTASSVLADTWAAVGRGRGPTSPAPRVKGRIDYLFHSGELTPLSAQTVATGLSDHFAVLARYRLGFTRPC